MGWRYKHITAKEVEEAILKFHKEKTLLQIAADLEVKKSTIYSISRKLSISKVTKYSSEEIAFLRSNYRTMGNAEIGNHIGRSADSVKDKMSVLGLKRSYKELNALRRRLNPGQFKTGHTPLNTREVGSVKLHNDGTWWIKTENGIEQYRHYLYKKHHGIDEIPKGMVVLLNQQVERYQDIDPSKMLLVSKSVNQQLNQNPNFISPVIYSDRHIAGLISKQTGVSITAVLKNKALIEAQRAQILLDKKLRSYGS